MTRSSSATAARYFGPIIVSKARTGAGFRAALETTRASLVLRKGIHRDIESYSAIYEHDHKTPTGLSSYLRERELKTLFFDGLAFDFCVRYWAEDARQAGFEAVQCLPRFRRRRIAATHHSLKSLGIPTVGIEAFF
jgi:nicotinamidase/pyrazinamidase